MSDVRVLIADEQPVVLAGLRGLLRRFPDIELVGAVRDAHEAVRETARLHPDIVLLDIAMQDMAGADAVSAIHTQSPGTHVVVFSSNRAADWVHKSFELGAVGYIVKDQDLDDLAAILRSIQAGETYLSPQLVDTAVLEFTQTPKRRTGARTLTQREQQVLELLVQEKSSKEIAALLAISPRTVSTHRANIMRKLATHSITGLVRYALRAGLDVD